MDKEVPKFRVFLKGRHPFLSFQRIKNYNPVIVHFPDIHQLSNIYIPGLARQDPAPEEYPGRSRDREGYWYSDEEVASLPDIAADHPKFRNWRERKRSCQRLVRYLAFRKKSVSILEVGCGNGWLAFQLATVPGSRVVGLDMNFSGLQQAARVFRHQPNLKFMMGDFCSDLLEGLNFDIIVFAGSIHHFPSVQVALEAAFQQLAKGGEIHILDTPAPCLRKLKYYRHRLRYNPGSLWNRLTHKGKGHPWIVVRGL